MTPMECAAVFRQAARVVGQMDPRQQWYAQAAQMQQNGWVGRSYSQQESAAWEAYSAASSVLSAIAAEYEKAATDTAALTRHSTATKDEGK